MSGIIEKSTNTVSDVKSATTDSTLKYVKMAIEKKNQTQKLLYKN